MAKATVQAALGPIALKHLSADDPDVPYAQIVLMLCILSIVVTAPTGAILISITGTKLLTKTKNTHMPEGLNAKFMKIRFFSFSLKQEYFLFRLSSSSMASSIYSINCYRRGRRG